MVVKTKSGLSLKTIFKSWLLELFDILVHNLYHCDCGPLIPDIWVMQVITGDNIISMMSKILINFITKQTKMNSY